MRHSDLGPGAVELPGLIPLLSFPRQIPVGAHEAKLSSHPNITHFSSFSLSLSLFEYIYIYIQYISPLAAAQHLLHGVSWQGKVIITAHASCTPTPARACHHPYRANILRNSPIKKRKKEVSSLHV